MSVEALVAQALDGALGSGAWSLREALRLTLLSGVFTAVCLLAFPRNAPTRRLLLLAAVVALALLPAFLLSFDAVWMVALREPPAFTLAAPLPNLALALWLTVATVLIVRHLVSVHREISAIGALTDLERVKIGETLRVLLPHGAAPPRVKLGDRACSTTLGPATVVLPVEWASWDARTLTSVLAHELTHVARRDDRWLLLTRIVVLFYWWMPWLIWLYRLHVRTMEESCDDAASELVGVQHAYVEALVDVAGGVGRRGDYRSVANMHEHHLVGRVGRFLKIRDVELDTRGVYWWVIGIGFFVVCLTGIEPVLYSENAARYARASGPAVHFPSLAGRAESPSPTHKPRIAAELVLGDSGRVPRVERYRDMPRDLTPQARAQLAVRLDTPVYAAPVIYPGSALRGGVEGVVVTEYTVGRDGAVTDLVVVASEPAGIFDAAATRALENTRYAPEHSGRATLVPTAALRASEPTLPRVREHVSFRLRQR